MNILGRQTATETRARGRIHGKCGFFDQCVEIGVRLLCMQFAEQSCEAADTSFHFTLAAADVGETMRHLNAMAVEEVC